MRLTTLQFIGAALVLVIGVRGVHSADEPLPITAEQEEFFEKRIRPVLSEHCFACHGVTKTKVGLDLTRRESVLAGSDAGSVVVPGDPDKSLLIRALRYDDGDIQMPPEGKLPDDVIEAMAEWVRMGLPWPVARDGAGPGENAEDESYDQIMASHWSFQPVSKVTPPAIDDDWIATPVDAFVLQKLRESNLEPSPAADRRTLIRRASYDLIGLPPTFEDTEAFVQDDSPDAYERLIERLLDSPQYGERWARHWLDVARYSDTKGYVFAQERRYVYAHTYRDYVIKSLNDDKPYDQFVMEQIAADQLDLGDDNSALAAMGYLTLGRRFVNNIHDIIDDRIDVLTRGFQGLTVTCARCHDHKYDPIPAADYYSLYGVFRSSIEPVELPVIGMAADTAAYAEYMQELENRKKAYDDFTAKAHHELLTEFRTRVDEYLLKLTEPRNTSLQEFQFVYRVGDIRNQIVDRWFDYLSDLPGDHPVFSPWKQLEGVDTGATAEAERALAQLTAPGESGAATPRLNARVGAAISEKQPTSRKDLASIYGELFRQVEKEWRDLLAVDSSAGALPDADAEELRLVLYEEKSPVVLDPDFTVKQLIYDDGTNNKVFELRRLIEEWQNQPALAPPRAHVLEDNKTLYEPAVFVRGNPSMLGDKVPRQFLKVVSGEERTPFQQGSGRLELAQAIASPDNPLTARVMVNRIWQHHFGQGIVRTPSDFGTRGDPPTHPELLDDLAMRFVESGWSIKSMHRLIMRSNTYRQASAYRDDAYKIDPDNKLLWRFNRHRLDFEAMRDSMLAAAGRLDLTVGGPSVEITTAPYSTRRSVYAFIERQNLPEMFRIFDFASPDTHAPHRYQTTVPQQSLFMMNSPFVIEQAKHLASRPEVAATEETPSRIKAMHQLAIGRPPTDSELLAASRFIKDPAREKTDAVQAPPVWRYGYGEYDQAAQRLLGFKPLTHWTGIHWQAEDAFPSPTFGYLFIAKNAGHVGADDTQAPVRRWVSPVEGTVEVDGTLKHHQGDKQGDGVEAWVVHSRHGELGHWTVHISESQTRAYNIQVELGDTIDFVVGGRANPNYDGWNWAPNVKLVQPAEGTTPTRTEWNDLNDFAGPAEQPLTAIEQYAQILLMANEFAFVD